MSSNTRIWGVFGPPGTGKTTWLADHAGDSVEKFGRDQVSVCSLTRAAVVEVSGRDTGIDPENVTTLHARCKRALGAGPPAEKFMGEFSSAYPLWRNYLPPHAAAPDLVTGEEEIDAAEIAMSGGGTPFDLMNYYRQTLTPEDLWDKDVLRFSKAWLGWCADTNRYDYTGWLEACLRNPDILPPQQVVYVDEAQDHTPLQLGVLQESKSNFLVLIGDDDQNLFEWSGALPRRFLEIPKESEIVLRQSYRIPASVHRKAISWAKQIKVRKQKDYLPREVEGNLYMSGYTFKDAESRKTLPERLLAERGKDYMILASCAYMLSPIMTELRMRGIPVHNPYKKGTRWNPLQSVHERLDEFRGAEWTGKGVMTWASVLSRKEVFKEGMYAELERVCEAAGDERVSHDLLRLCVKPELYERVVRRDVSLFRQFRRKGVTGSWEYALKVMDRPLEDQVPRVIVGTIHSVKGGQADHVYLMPDLSGAGDRDFSNPENRDRTIRLFYVGMTRARESLTLCSRANYYGVDWRTE